MKINYLLLLCLSVVGALSGGVDQKVKLTKGALIEKQRSLRLAALGDDLDAISDFKYDSCVEDLERAYRKQDGSMWAHALWERYHNDEDPAAWDWLCSMGRTDGRAHKNGFIFDTEQSVSALRSVAIRLAGEHDLKKLTAAATLIGHAKALPGYSEVIRTSLHAFYINYLTAHAAFINRDHKAEEEALRMAHFGRKSADEAAQILIDLCENRLQELEKINQ